MSCRAVEIALTVMRPRVAGVCGFARWLVVASLIGLFPAPVLAHGTAPAALSLVRADERGALLVRLQAGLALRQSDAAYRLLCPAAWGDDSARPALALADGSVVVLSGSGLQLLDHDGNASAHPDPEAAGPAIDAVTVTEHVYVLRPSGTGTEIIELTAQHVRSIWSDAEVWTALAAGADFLALARLDEHDELEVLRLTPAGEVTLRQHATAPDGCTSVSVRVLGDELYLSVAWNGGRQLGQIADGRWRKLTAALSSIAGPIAIDAEHEFVALDGALASVANDGYANLESSQPDQTASVSCLGRYASQAYACTREGLRALEPQGLGAVLFDFATLRAPDLSRLPQALHERCEQQWLHLQLDLANLGVVSPAADEPAADGGKASGTPAKSHVGGACALAAGPATTPRYPAALLALTCARLCRRRLKPKAAASSAAAQS